MSLRSFINGHVPEPDTGKKRVIKKTGTKKKQEPRSCKDCAVFPHYKNIDFDADYFYKSGIGKHTLAFILSPMDFENLKKFQWKHIICANLQQYNILFLPYPRCYVNAFAEQKVSVKTQRICRDNFINKFLVSYEVDLVIVFPETKDIMALEEGQVAIDHVGNWEKYQIPQYGERPIELQLYLAKGLFSVKQRGFNNEGFKHTVERINRYFNNELVWQRVKNFDSVTTLPELEKAFEEIHGQEIVAVDVETSGLNPLVQGFALKTIGLYWPGRAVCIGYTVEECVDVQYRARVKQLVTALLADKTIVKVCHNVKFETKVFLHELGEDIEMNAMEDTMFLSYLFDENRPSNGLKALAGEYFDGYPKVMADFANYKLQDLVFYNCLDAYYTMRLKLEVFIIEQLPAPLPDWIRYVYYDVMIPLAFEIALLELGGVKLDYEYLITLQKKLEEDLAAIGKEIETNFPQTIGRNLGSPQQLGAILFGILRFPEVKKTETGQASTDDETLVTLKEKHGCKLAELLLKKREKDKQLSTYVTPYIENRAAYFGDRVRSNYNQIKDYAAAKGEAKGTVTGRLSSAGPNLQNVPRDKTIKRIFVPESKDRVFLQADLSQAELRIAASLAKEPTMLDVYAHDGDIHWITGLKIAPPDWIERYKALPEGKEKSILFKDIRQPAKPANFGLIYGGWFTVLQRLAKQDYGIEFSDDQAKDIHRKFFELYNALPAWHASVIAYATQHGYVISPFGRVRRVPDIQFYGPRTREYSDATRQAINSPVQGACADFLAQIWYWVAREARKRKIPVKTVLTVHDSLVWDIEKSAVDELKHLHTIRTKALTEFHQEYWLKCPMKIDFELGDHWGALVEQKD